MTKLLEKAIDQLKNLPKAQQNAVAQLLLDEVNWELKDLSPDAGKLGTLASEALNEYRKGDTRPMDE